MKATDIDKEWELQALLHQLGRTRFKTIMYAIAYQASDETIEKTLGIDRDKIKEARNRAARFRIE